MRLEIPERKTLVAEQTIAIRWGDMDAMGHLNNTTYFRYIETCRVDWMCSVGMPPGTAGEGPVILNAFCNFQRQIAYPGDVLVKLYVSDPARTTLETWATMERTDQPGIVCASGGGTMIWVDFPSQKAITMPDWLRKLVG